MDEDLEPECFEYRMENRIVHESQGDLTLEMLGGEMPKHALGSIKQSPQHPGESGLTDEASEFPMSDQRLIKGTWHNN